MRLDKFLSDCGIDTRSKCKAYIKQGRVFVNGAVQKDGSIHIQDQDVVSFDGKDLVLEKNLYYMFYKPAGCICATKDPVHKLVLDYFPDNLKKKLLLAGRLDKDTEGLLFLTDDGSFVHHLMAPSKHVAKTYYFEGEGCLSENAAASLKEGIDIGDEKPTKPADLIIDYEKDRVIKGRLTITEGRYHQVKRMIKAVGADIYYLKRLSIGEIMLDEDLEPGQYRQLSDKELAILNFKREN